MGDLDFICIALTVKAKYTLTVFINMPSGTTSDLISSREKTFIMKVIEKQRTGTGEIRRQIPLLKPKGK